MTLHDVRPAPCFEPRSAGNLTGITTSGGTLRDGRACRSQTLYQFESVLKIKVVLKYYYELIFDCTFGSRNLQVKIVLSSNRMGGLDLLSPFKLYPYTFKKTHTF